MREGSGRKLRCLGYVRKACGKRSDNVRRDLSDEGSEREEPQVLVRRWSSELHRTVALAACLLALIHTTSQDRRAGGILSRCVLQRERGKVNIAMWLMSFVHQAILSGWRYRPKLARHSALALVNVAGSAQNRDLQYHESNLEALSTFANPCRQNRKTGCGPRTQNARLSFARCPNCTENP